MLSNLLKKLRTNGSELLKVLPGNDEKKQEQMLLAALKLLAKVHKAEVIKQRPELAPLFSDIYTLDRLVEEFYNYWKSHERYIVCISEYNQNGVSEDDDLDRRPYRTFNDTIEKLNHMVRKVYRDIQENITGEHPSIYRQVPAGCQVGAIAKPKEIILPHDYFPLKKIPLIHQ